MTLSKHVVLAALLSLPELARQEVIAEASAPQPEAKVLAHISPAGVVREPTPVYDAQEAAVSSIILATRYKVGEPCPFCAEREKASAFKELVAHSNPDRIGTKRATFADCKHRVNVRVGG